ncbi:MAG: DUF1674 domain-containing protein [Hirschia sp.]|nr:DUF1674 domain-containing protein [Hirschia sp.]MBF17495.1 DUF1674 domain-containing protein [Hirschia sp.]|tara:strand:+ start:584 stop:835 length:252 start_codon:yes stop_codon:yes gene_type:complete
MSDDLPEFTVSTPEPAAQNLPPGAAPGKVLSQAARDALEEAAERRKREDEAKNSDTPKEYNGPSGEEPTRFGDWERKGITYDF